MHKALVLTGCMLLVFAAVPGVTAHLTNEDGSATSFGVGGAVNPDPCRYASTDNEIDGGAADAGPCGNLHSGVSGSYVLNPRGAYRLGIGDPDTNGETGIQGPEVDNIPEPAEFDQNDDGCHNEAGDMGCTFGVAPTLFPSGASSGGGGALCDAEVIDASGVADESTVDGDDSVGGAQPDGTWDDGGFGGACHTPSTHYQAQPDWNTAGCGDGTASAVAHAEDWTAGDFVYILPACSYQQAQTTGGRALVLPIDWINAFLGSPTDPATAIGEAQEDFEEFADFMAGIVDPTVACVGGDGPDVNCISDVAAGGGTSEVVCEVDSASDASNAGFGGGAAVGSSTIPGTVSVPPASGAGDGVAFPGIVGDCASELSNGDAIANVFVVHTSAFTEGVWDASGTPISPAGAVQSTGGWIDSTAE